MLPKFIEAITALSFVSVIIFPQTLLASLVETVVVESPLEILPDSTVNHVKFNISGSPPDGENPIDIKTASGLARFDVLLHLSKTRINVGCLVEISTDSPPVYSYMKNGGGKKKKKVDSESRFQDNVHNDTIKFESFSYSVKLKETLSKDCALNLVNLIFSQNASCGETLRHLWILVDDLDPSHIDRKSGEMTIVPDHLKRFSQTEFVTLKESLHDQLETKVENVEILPFSKTLSDALDQNSRDIISWNSEPPSPLSSSASSPSNASNQRNFQINVGLENIIIDRITHPTSHYQDVLLQMSSK